MKFESTASKIVFYYQPNLQPYVEIVIGTDKHFTKMVDVTLAASESTPGTPVCLTDKNGVKFVIQYEDLVEFIAAIFHPEPLH